MPGMARRCGIPRREQLRSESERGSDLEVEVLWGPRDDSMTGTPSQRQLRYREVSVGRKLEANFGAEAHEPCEGARARLSQRCMARPALIPGRERGRGGFEGRSRALPREASVPVGDVLHDETGLGSPVHQSPDRDRRPALLARDRSSRSAVSGWSRRGQPQGAEESAEVVVAGGSLP